MNQLEIIIFAALIGADSPILTEDEKQAILSRFGEDFRSDNDTTDMLNKKNWTHILQPIIDEDKREKYIKLMESAQREEIEQEIEESKLNDIEPVDMEVLKD